MQYARLYGWLVMASVAALGAVLLVASAVHAVSSGTKMFISADNTFYMYVRGGETINASFIKSSEIEPGGLAKHDISVTLEGPSLPAKKCVLAKDVAVDQGCELMNITAPETGVYRISVVLPQDAQPYAAVSPQVKWGGNLFSWKIQVKDGQTEKTGRVWSELYAVRQPVPDSFLENATYYYVSEDGYIYRATYKGYNGQISTFSADAVGVRENGKCTSAYQSIQSDDNKYSPSFGECGGSYKLFFEQPSGDLPASAKGWDGKSREWIIPTVLPPTVSDLTFESDKNSDMQSGTIKFRLKNFVGQYSVGIDTDGDHGFSGQADLKVVRTMKKVSNDLQSIHFDGVDANGQVVAASQPIGIRINVEKVAEIHLVNADVEGRTGGLELVRINGENAPSSRMCWNDTYLNTLADTTLQTKKIDGRSCADSTGGLHGWPYATGSWGDNRYIDDWAYAAARVAGVAGISYPDDKAATNGPAKNNRWLIIGGSAVLTIGFVVLVATFIVKRRRHAKLLREAARQHQPIDFPGPGDPRPPTSS